MTIIILVSFFAGILSVLAPCVLPVLPVLFGGGLSGTNTWKTIRILISALICIFIFTLLLKVSTAFIAIPYTLWANISGLIIIMYGLTLVRPRLRYRIQKHIPQISSAPGNGSIGSDILLGASLGPIFTSCSPTYALLLGTILPANLTTGIWGIVAYLIGFGSFLYILVMGGRTLITKRYSIANPTGGFKKILGWILIGTGILIMTGAMKTIETKIIKFIPGLTTIEFFLADTLSGGDTNQETNRMVEKQGSITTDTSRHYRDYDPDNLPQAGDIVLFFHADRCPSCQEAEKNFLESAFPSDLTILKVNYDTATDLKIRYRVLSQTSFVLIDPDGTMIKRRIGARTLDDIIEKIAEVKATIDTDSGPNNDTSNTIPTIQSIAYFAGGCFWCLEGPFEGLDGVFEVINGYAGGSADTAIYSEVSSGKTDHKEAVKVVYNPLIISYQELLDVYRRQIDPTDDGGQFADRGPQYKTAIFYQNEQEQTIATQSKQSLETKKKFTKSIVVDIIAFTSFYPAEEYHQDYYKKQSADYKAYKKGSGREDFIDINRGEEDSSTNIQTNDKDNLDFLTPEQRYILFEGGTEPPFDNAYRDFHETGIYVDVIDGTALFSSLDKFDSNTGRPSFTRPIDEALLGSKSDTSFGIERTEIISSSSNGHLGHVFDDGPSDQGGKRYCINSAALQFIPLADMQAKGYEKYIPLFDTDIVK